MKYSTDATVNNLLSPTKPIERDCSLRSQIFKKQKELDEMIFHWLMYRIVRNNYELYMAFISSNEQKVDIDQTAFFVNKYLFDFMNAFYMHTEYLRNKGRYLSQIQHILDSHYHGKQGYRFLCGYRNAVVHQSAFQIDFGKDGKPYINLSELIANNEAHIKCTGKDDNEFGEVLKGLREKSVKIGEYDFISATEIIELAFPEYIVMVLEVANYLYENKVEPHLLWLIKKLYKPANTSHSYHTIYVDEEKSMGLDINRVIDDFIVAFRRQLPQGYDLLLRFDEFLKKTGYEMIFT